MKKSDIKIFVCVPAVGKSYLSRIDDRFVDMDTMKAMYKYGYPENMTVEEFEKTKSNRGEVKNHDSTEFMRRKMYEELQKGKYLLFAPNPKMVDMINEEKQPYCMVYASLNAIDILGKRMKKRGNIDKFVEEMIKVGYEKYEFHKNDPRPAYKLELQSGQYLSDVIYAFLGIEK